MRLSTSLWTKSTHAKGLLVRLEDNQIKIVTWSHAHLLSKCKHLSPRCNQTTTANVFPLSAPD